MTTSNQVINSNEDNLRVRERHRIIFALLSLIIMKESNHFYIYTLHLRIHLRVESQNIQIYVNALHSISLSFRPVLTQHAGHFEQTYVKYVKICPKYVKICKKYVKIHRYSQQADLKYLKVLSQIFDGFLNHRVTRWSSHQFISSPVGVLMIVCV